MHENILVIVFKFDHLINCEGDSSSSIDPRPSKEEIVGYLHVQDLEVYYEVYGFNVSTKYISPTVSPFILSQGMI